MKFDEAKKKAITSYILEKIDRNDKSISKHVAEAFGINQNTVHSYIDKLLNDGSIVRVKRGEYILSSQRSEYLIKKIDGKLDDEMYAYNHYLKKHIENLPKNVVQIWEYAFSEMMNNVIDHSGADMVTITVETNPLTTTVTIEDNGVGIFEKIMNYFSFDTQETAICELFKGKLTTDSKNHSGEGIFFSSKMMDEFFILSDGNTFTTNKYKRSKTEDMEKTEGTCVIMRLSNATKRSTKEIFDMYSNVDEGLTKTVIMIKNIFDTSPVSRSQAKRICYRLDEHFSEVILDFEDVEWMGQGFAHQIFCVFQEEHPDIILTIKNMNEDVSKMYAHVRAEKL